MGTPKRCDEPTAMSKPSCPGGAMSVHAIKSVAAIATALFSCAAVVRVQMDSKEGRAPLLPGHETTTAK